MKNNKLEKLIADITGVMQKELNKIKKGDYDSCLPRDQASCISDWLRNAIALRRYELAVNEYEKFQEDIEKMSTEKLEKLAEEAIEYRKRKVKKEVLDPQERKAS